MLNHDQRNSALCEYVASYFRLLLCHPGAKVGPAEVMRGRDGRELTFRFDIEPPHIDAITVTVPLDLPITRDEFRLNHDDFLSVFTGGCATEARVPSAFAA